MSHMSTKKRGQNFPRASFTDLKQLSFFLGDDFAPLLSLSRPLWLLVFSWSHLHRDVDVGRDGPGLALAFHPFLDINKKALPPTLPASAKQTSSLFSYRVV